MIIESSSCTFSEISFNPIIAGILKERANIEACDAIPPISVMKPKQPAL